MICARYLEPRQKHIETVAPRNRIEGPLILRTTSLLQQSFHEVETLFTEGQAGIRAAYDAGVPRSATIVAFSPALGDCPKVSIADRDVLPRDIQKFVRRFSDLSEAVERTLSADPDLSDGAIVCARVTRGFEREAYALSCLSPQSLDRPFAIAAYGMNAFPWFDGPWRKLLGSLDTFAGSIEVPASERPATLDGETENARFVTRLRFEGWKSIAYRMLRKATPRVEWPNEGDLLQIGENTLIKESVFHLAARGRLVRQLWSIETPRSACSEISAQDIDRALGSLFETHLADLLDRRLYDIARCALASGIADAVNRYRAAATYWRELSSRNGGRMPGGLLMNHNIRPEIQALVDLMKSKNRPVFGFQHGTGPELTTTHDKLLVEQDSSACTTFFVYNEAAKRNAEQSSNRDCQGHVVGLPRDIADLPKMRRETEYPILYCTNRAFLGHLHRPVALGIPDHQTMRREDLFVDEVLSRIPHPVTIKTYPSWRYPEPHPSYQRARRHANITVFDALTDMRYLLPKARILITALGHSTITWCVLSGKPVVFVDQRDQNPIREECRELFEAGLIYFSSEDENIHDKLRHFLSKPLREIEAEYQSRKTARQELIRRFMGDDHGRGGILASRAIIDQLNGSRHARDVK